MKGVDSDVLSPSPVPSDTVVLLENFIQNPMTGKALVAAAWVFHLFQSIPINI